MPVVRDSETEKTTANQSLNYATAKKTKIQKTPKRTRKVERGRTPWDRARFRIIRHQGATGKMDQRCAN